MFKKFIRNPSGRVGLYKGAHEITVPEGCHELLGEELAIFLASDENPEGACNCG